MSACSTQILKVVFVSPSNFKSASSQTYSRTVGAHLLLSHLLFAPDPNFKSKKGKVCNNHLKSAIPDLWYKRCQGGWCGPSLLYEQQCEQEEAGTPGGAEEWGLHPHSQHLQTDEGSTGPCGALHWKLPYLSTSGLISQVPALCEHSSALSGTQRALKSGNHFL